MYLYCYILCFLFLGSLVVMVSLPQSSSHRPHFWFNPSGSSTACTRIINCTSSPLSLATSLYKHTPHHQSLSGIIYGYANRPLPVYKSPAISKQLSCVLKVSTLIPLSVFFLSMLCFPLLLRIYLSLSRCLLRLLTHMLHSHLLNARNQVIHLSYSSK